MREELPIHLVFFLFEEIVNIKRVLAIKVFFLLLFYIFFFSSSFWFYFLQKFFLYILSYFLITKILFVLLEHVSLNTPGSRYQINTSGSCHRTQENQVGPLVALLQQNRAICTYYDRSISKYRSVTYYPIFHFVVPYLRSLFKLVVLSWKH